MVLLFRRVTAKDLLDDEAPVYFEKEAELGALSATAIKGIFVHGLLRDAAGTLIGLNSSLEKTSVHGIHGSPFTVRKTGHSMT